MEELISSELKLGDVVELFDGPFGTATVKQIKDGSVTFFRPYVATANFSCTGGVICTIGIEEFSRAVTDVDVPRKYQATFKLWRRGGELQ